MRKELAEQNEKINLLFKYLDECDAGLRFIDNEHSKNILEKATAMRDESVEKINSIHSFFIFINTLTKTRLGKEIIELESNIVTLNMLIDIIQLSTQLSTQMKTKEKPQ